MHSSELLKGTVQMIVMKVLADHGKMYGYEITQKVKDLSEGSIILTEGALYPRLHRMEELGLVNAETVYIGKRMRKYYTLTREGVSVVEQKVPEFAAFVRTMRHVLDLRTI